MSRRPSKLYVHRDDRVCQLTREATSDEVLAVVRRGVESGTIAGGIVDTDSRAGFWLADHLEQFPPKTYLVIEVEQR